MGPNPPACFFTDITDFIQLAFRDDLKQQAPRMSPRDLQATFATVVPGRSVICDRAFCVVHRRWCRATRADIHVAGTPCIAWSSFGSRLGTSGATALCFFVWIALRIMLQEDAVLHENVVQFNQALFESMLGRFCVVFSVVMDSIQHGQVAARPRRYTWLLHRRILQSGIFMPRSLGWNDTFVSKFFQELACSWEVILGVGE